MKQTSGAAEPVDSPPAARSREEDGPSDFLEARIVLIEDDEMLSRTVARHLERLGCRVLQYGSMEEALGDDQWRHSEVLLTDMMLPGASGLEVLTKVRETCPSIKVVAMSGSADFEMVLSCLRRGADDFIKKPFTIAELEGAIGSALHKGWLAEVNAIHRQGRSLLDVKDVDVAPQMAVDLAASLLRAEAAALLVPDGSGGFTVAYTSAGTSMDSAAPALRGFEQIADTLSGRAPSDEALLSPQVEQHHLIFPIIGAEEPLGVLCLSRPPSGLDFSGRDLQRMGVLADHVILALENSSRVRRLLSADRLVTIGELTASVTHEVNNALAFMLSNLNYVAEEVAGLRDLAADHSDPRSFKDAWEKAMGADGIEELAEAAAEAATGAQRIADVIREMRLLSHVGGDGEVPVDLRHCVDSAARLVGSAIVPRLTIEETGDRPAIARGNPGLLSQIFVNLLLNASQAIETSKEGTEILVRVKCEGEEAVVEVVDDGPGIPPQIANRVFEPFLSTKPAGKGTGLGLSISRDIAERHGGRLTLRTQVGEGTTFELRLPLDPSEEEPI